MKDLEINQKRILAVDVGSVRMGLALWNPKSRLAECLPHRKRKLLKEDLNFFENLLRENEIEAILVGIPLSLAGNSTSSTKNAEFWVETFRSHFELPVYTYDESLSSKEALKVLKDQKLAKRMELKDSVSAALFLEEFIRAQSS